MTASKAFRKTLPAAAAAITLCLPPLLPIDSAQADTGDAAKQTCLDAYEVLAALSDKQEGDGFDGVSAPLPCTLKNDAYSTGVTVSPSTNMPRDDEDSLLPPSALICSMIKQSFANTATLFGPILPPNEAAKQAPVTCTAKEQSNGSRQYTYTIKTTR